MKSWLVRLLNIKTKETFPVVWDAQRPSLYARLEQTYEQAHPLPWDNNVLPCQPLEGSDEVFWAPGALEGTMIYHFGSGGGDTGAEEILSRLQQATGKPNASTMQALYDLIIQGSPLHYIDELLKAIPTAEGLRADRLNALLLFLCTRSPDQNAIKFAMALLVFFPQQQSVDLLQVLGRHDEFTLYAVVALRSMLTPEHYAERWFAMAQRVDGWGRVHLMERMPEMLDDKMRGWLLREGFSNSVMNEYTAVNCAVHGELCKALASEHDDALLLGAAEIVCALLNEDSVPGMSVYDDAVETCQRYLQNVIAQQPAHPLHYLTAKRIGEWARQEASLPPSLSARLATMSAEILALNLWDDVTRQALAGDAGYLFNLAIDVCRDRQNDPFPLLFARQRDMPESTLWYQLMQTEDINQAIQVCSLAETQFDLNALASGPTLSSGTGPKWNVHRHLDSLLQELKRFPETGWSLLKAALRSPVIRNRQMALNALEAWPLNSLSVHLHYIEECVESEPYEEVQQRLKGLRDRLCQHG